MNVWRLAGDTLNITCNFLYCNHQVHRDFLITLYKQQMEEKHIEMSASNSQTAILLNTNLNTSYKVHTLLLKTVKCNSKSVTFKFILMRYGFRAD
jgi:hypothetical protein